MSNTKTDSARAWYIISRASGHEDVPSFELDWAMKTVKDNGTGGKHFREFFFPESEEDYSVNKVIELGIEKKLKSASSRKRAKLKKSNKIIYAKHDLPNWDKILSTSQTVA